MLQSITQRARHPSAATRETEREVVAAISSAEGSANLARGGGRALGFALPLLALAAGVALGYGGTRWLGQSPWRRVPPDPWQRLANAARPILEAAGKARFPTLR